jgi:hypothetical protein
VVENDENVKTFHIHKGLLIFHCSYSDHAFYDPQTFLNTRESATLDDDPEIFQSVYNFVCTL